MFINIDPRPAKKVQLFVKLTKAGAAFMVNFGIGNQSYLKAIFVNTDTVFNIFA